jgi:hypothetical protein
MVRIPQVFRYRIRNWHEYNRALINRGRLMVDCVRIRPNRK